MHDLELAFKDERENFMEAITKLEHEIETNK